MFTRNKHADGETRNNDENVDSSFAIEYVFYGLLLEKRVEKSGNGYDMKNEDP